MNNADDDETRTPAEKVKDDEQNKTDRMRADHGLPVQEPVRSSRRSGQSSVSDRDFSKRLAIAEAEIVKLKKRLDRVERGTASP